MTLAKELNKRITIQRKSHTKDSFGGNVESWTNVGNVWAGVAPVSLTRRRQTKQGGEESVTSIPIKVRFGVDVAIDDRILFRGATYEVKQIENPGFANRVLVLTCESLPLGAI
ncbi:phage head closure protein [Pseudoduganella eburnea]|uniref:Phage head closure protein n=1 Tax=Massilia eburnea TaxID=1776165 RepID=A0A6L6QHQ0_9BURK|nr:phage head closure protein [Massilia eburnea]MTW11427.1 phage head closure protein [Massilia eburnea]